MNAPPSVLGNMSRLAAGYAVARIAQIVFILAVSLFYDMADYGLFSIALATVLTVAILADVGLDQVITRELARSREAVAHTLPTLIALRGGLAVLAGLLLLVYLPFIPGLSAGPGMLLVAVWLATVTLLLGLTRAVLRAFEHMGTEALAGVLERTSQVALGVLVIAGGGSPVWLLAALAAGTTLALLYAGSRLAQAISPLSLGWNKELGRRYLLLAMPFWLSAITIELLHRIDIQMLAWLSAYPLLHNGQYRIAISLVEGTFLLPQVVAVALLPRLAIQHQAEGMNAAWLHQALRLPLAASVAIAALLSILFLDLAPHISATWVPATTTVIVMAWMIPPVYANYVLGTVLAAGDRQGKNLQAALLALVVNVALNALLIPRHGAVGAAGAIVVGQLVYMLGLYWHARQLVPGMGFGWLLARVLFAAALPALLMIHILRLGLPPNLHGAFATLAVLIYLGLAWVLGLWRAEDIRFAWNAMRRSPG